MLSARSIRTAWVGTSSSEDGDADAEDDVEDNNVA